MKWAIPRTQLIGVATVAGVAASVGLSVYSVSSTNDAKRETRKNAGVVAAVVEDNVALRKQLEARGIEPVVPPPDSVAIAIAADVGVVGEPGAKGDKGDPPSGEEIAAAIAAYCSTGRCTGPTGPSGAPGLKGDKGDPGEPGIGIQGEIGLRGPGPTDAQVYAMIQAFCGIPGNCIVQLPPGP